VFWHTVPSNGVFTATDLMSTVETWIERTEMLDSSQRDLITGGALSKRFSRLPLWLSHPANISGFYGLLVSFALILPYMMTNDYWEAAWILHSSLLIVSCLVLGMCSRIIVAFTKRMPVIPIRKVLYPMPFIGLGLFALSSTDLLTVHPYISWTFLMVPGPLYVHLSWAPRWRLLCMIEDGIDPFEGMNTPERTEEVSEVAGDDSEMVEVIEEFDSEE
jgi:hypothetical protein